MNYSKSKDPIVPIKNDSVYALDQLKKRIQARTNTEIPFFLMPVRLETRFMKAINRLILVDESTLNDVDIAIGDGGTLVAAADDYGVFEGFTDDTALAAAVELNQRADTFYGTLQEFDSINLYKKEYLNGLITRIDQSFQDTALWLQENCDDPVKSADLDSQITSFNSKIQTIFTYIENLSIDTSWSSQVSTDALGTQTALNNIIQSNAAHIGNMQTGEPGAIIEAAFDSFVGTSRELFGIIDQFKTFEPLADTSPIVNKLYFWTHAKQIGEQISEIYELIEDTRVFDQAYADGLKLELYRLDTELRFAWYDLASPDTLAKNWLTPFELPYELQEEDINALPIHVTNLGGQIAQEVQNSDAILQDLTGEEAQWEDTIFDDYNNAITGIKTLVSTFNETDSHSKAFIYNQLAPLNEQFVTLADHIKVQDWETSVVNSKVGLLNAGIATLGHTYTNQVFSGTVKPTHTFTTEGDFQELQIRVYPDDIAIQYHEEKLTPKEEQAGKDYWTSVYAANGDPKKLLAAWKILVDLFGAERAAWIVKVLTPTNSSGGTTGGGSTTTSSFYKAVNQSQLLTQYTNQLQTVGWSTSVPAAIQTHIDFYTPHLQDLYGTVSAIEQLPADQLTILSDSIDATIISFSGFQDVIATTFPEEEFAWGELEFQVDQLGSTVEGIESVPSWGAVYSGTPSFPTVQLKDEGWENSPRSYVMPDRFLFALIDDDNPNTSTCSYIFRHIQLGNLIPNTLITGLNPKATASSQLFSQSAINNLIINDPEIRWIYDFEYAIKKGMAVAIRLTQTERYVGFHKVIALGLKLEETSSVGESQLRTNGKRLLQDLLNSHHYTSGLELLRIGTPTNNTEGVDAGFKTPDPYAENSFKKEVWYSLFNPSLLKLSKKDGQWLADALGVDYATFYHVGNSNLTQISSAISMNRALFKGTVGNFMAEMMNPLFTLDNVKQTRKYFTDYVLARGAVPSIRVGNQPYGILPVSSFGRWGIEWKLDVGVAVPEEKHPTEWYDYYANSAFNPLLFEDRFNMRLAFVLEQMTMLWLKMADTHVKTVDKYPDQANFVEMLGADATYAEAYTRFMLGNMSWWDAKKYMNAITANVDTYGVSGDNIQSYGSITTKWSNGTVTQPVNPGTFPLLSPNLPALFVGVFNNFSVFSNGPDQGMWDLPYFPYEHDPNVVPKSYQFQPELAIEKILRMFQTEQMGHSDPMKQAPDGGHYILRGPTVDEKKLSEISTLTPIKGTTYIQWLLDASLDDVWRNNQFGAMYSRSLLFLLMRQSTLLTYRDVAWDNLVHHGVFHRYARNLVGTPEGIKFQLQNNSNVAILTKWHLLFNSINSIHAGSTDAVKNLTNPLQFFTTLFNNTQLYPTNLNTPQIAIPQPTTHWYNQSMASHLKNQSMSLINYNEIDEFRGAMSKLNLCSTAELDRLMKEHIDLCTYRLDAWNYGMVNRRLWENRKSETATRKHGVYLGAYGWLINVTPKEKVAIRQDLHPLPKNLTDNANTTFYSSGSLGFIHAPSVAHALCAALLRCGYVSESDSTNNKFAVHLTSERVKLAMSVIEGIRHGQSLSAVLGYEFERGLHERYLSLNLDEYIYHFRRVFPLVPFNNVVNTQTQNEVRLSNVVDGTALLNNVKTGIKTLLEQNPKDSIWDLYQSNAFINQDIFGIPTLTVPSAGSSAEFDAIMAEVDRLENIVDALGDLMVAEGVFQIAKGNTVRSAAVLEAMAEGKTPPEPEIINTPRTGTNLTHRVVAAVEAIDTTGGIPSSPWPASSGLTPRAQAEPSLNKWVAQMLAAPFDSSVVTVGNFPTKVGCKVSFNDENDDPQEYDVLLSDLGIQPIDLVYMVQPGEFKQELTKRIAYHVRKNSGNAYAAAYTGISESVPLTIHYKIKGTANTTAVISFHQILSMLAHLYELIKASRPLQLKDFVSSHDVTASTSNPIVNKDELIHQNRLGTYSVPSFSANSVFETFRLLLGSFASIAATNDTQLNDLRTKLKKAAEFGVEFAMPVSASESFASGGIPVGDYAVEMLALGQQVRIELERRYTEALAKITSLGSLPSDEQVVNKYTQAATIIFGGNFTVLPLFNFNYYPSIKPVINDQVAFADPNHPSHSNSILRYFTAQNILVDEGVSDWFYGVARIQDKVGVAETLKLLSDDNNNYPLKKLAPVQFPHYTVSSVADYWLGSEYPSTYIPTSDKLSINIINPDTLAATTNNYCGLMIAEWTEIIPVTEEMTGVAFHYDQPTAKPPQNVLLAVCPRPVVAGSSTSWNLDEIIYTLLDTMEMAKVRMVEPDHFKRNGTDPETDKFEIFKWLLPAVVGEVTPHEVSVSGSVPVYSHVKYRGKMDSVQQVSFEYNVNNSEKPPNPDDYNNMTPLNDSPVGMIMNNLNDMDAEALVADTDIQSFAANEAALSQLTETQAQLNDLLNA